MFGVVSQALACPDVGEHEGEEGHDAEDVEEVEHGSSFLRVVSFDSWAGS
jgi:hypothetical protein